MFLGHFGLGFGAKRAAPAVSLGTLFLAAQLADLLWPNFLLLGLETVVIVPGITVVTPFDFVSYPYSHSLVALAIWGALLGLAYRILRRAGAVAALTLAALVVSHWVLDVLTHRPDMPLTLRGSERLGLGLWQSMPVTLAAEFLLFASGVALYLRTTEARDKTGRLAFWGLVVFLGIVYLVSVFGPPPPSATAVAWGGQAVWLLVAWGYWLDRHRRPVRAKA